MLDYVLHILMSFWTVLGAMAPYLLLGFFMAGLLSVLISPAFVERHLGGRGVWPVIKATLLGMPIPLCSCGVIPVSASLRRHGASKASTISFLISTPETGVDGIAVTYSLLGWPFALVRVIVALVSGLVGGLAVMLLDRPEAAADHAHIEPACQDSCCQPQAGGGRRHWLRRLVEYGFVDLPQDIGKSLLVGLAVAALISVLVPEDYFHDSALGGGIVAMLAMVALAGPVYVCATASVPMAMALIAKGVSPGAALVFLMVGPATNAATIAMVWKVMGPRTAAIYLAGVLGCALAAGLAMDYLFGQLGYNVHQAIGRHEMMHTAPWQSVCAVVLLGVLGWALVRRGKAKAATPAEFLMKTQTLRVGGMTCSHCAASVRRALLETPGVQAAEVDLSAGTAVVSGEGFDAAQLRQAVRALGYSTDEAPPG